MFKSFDEMIVAVKNMPVKKRVGIVAAEKDIVLVAANEMAEDGLAEPVLFGDRKKIEQLHADMDIPRKFEIVDCRDDEISAATAVAYAREGKIDLILKGKLDTPVLMKAVLNKETGIKTAGILCDVLVYEDPSLPFGDKRLIGLSDGGLIPLPDTKAKMAIIQTAADVFHKLGFARPKIALISANEKPSEKIPSTMEAAEIEKAHKNGELKVEAVVEGPYAIDNVISAEAAEIKGIKSEMAGKADILIMPNIETGNVFGKTLNYYCHAQNGHVIMGAKVPILVTSRADDARTKVNSVALGIIASN